MTCRTCLNTREWHEENNPVHPFNNGEAGATAFLKRRERKGSQRPAEVTQMSLPFDPVLRQALIDAEVITVDQLRTAEEKIRAVTAQFLPEGHNGK
jgi:hypothetical protein